MIRTVVSESSVEPVSLNEVKASLRMESTDSTAENALIRSYITAARHKAENITNRDLTVYTRQLILDGFWNSTQSIELPFSPLSTVATNVSITHVQNNTAGTTTTIASSSITVDFDSEPGRVSPAFDRTWTTDVRDDRKSVTIQYVTGYSTATTPVPEGIKTFIKVTVAGMYENREPLSEGIIREIPRNYVEGLLDPYIIKTAI